MRQPPPADRDPPPARGRLGGRVVTPAGLPVEEAQVIIATGPAHPDIAVLTGPDGRFDFGLLGAGRYLLRVQASGFPPRTEDVMVVPDLRAETLIVLRASPKHHEPPPTPRQPGREPRPGNGGGPLIAPELPPDFEDEE